MCLLHFVADSRFPGALISVQSVFPPFQFQKFLLSHPEPQSFLSPVQSTNEPAKAFFTSLKKILIFGCPGNSNVPTFTQTVKSWRRWWRRPTGSTWTFTESRRLVCWEQTAGSERQKWAEAAATAVFQVEVARGQSRLYFEERYENNCPVTGDGV